MMIKIWNEENNPQYFLRLLPSLEPDKHILKLSIVDGEGKTVPFGTLLILKLDGTFLRIDDVNPRIAHEAGLKLTPMGRIEINDD